MVRIVLKLHSSGVARLHPVATVGGSSLQFLWRGKGRVEVCDYKLQPYGHFHFSLALRVRRLKGRFVGSSPHKFRRGARSHRMICRPYPVLRVVAADIIRSCRSKPSTESLWAATERGGEVGEGRRVWFAFLKMMMAPWPGFRLCFDVQKAPPLQRYRESNLVPRRQCHGTLPLSQRTGDSESCSATWSDLAC